MNNNNLNIVVKREFQKKVTLAATLAGLTLFTGGATALASPFMINITQDSGLSARIEMDNGDFYELENVTAVYESVVPVGIFNEGWEPPEYISSDSFGLWVYSKPLFKDMKLEGKWETPLAKIREISFEDWPLTFGAIGRGEPGQIVVNRKNGSQLQAVERTHTYTTKVFGLNFPVNAEWKIFSVEKNVHGTQIASAGGNELHILTTNYHKGQNLKYELVGFRGTDPNGESVMPYVKYIKKITFR